MRFVVDTHWLPLGEAYLIPIWLMREQRPAQVKTNQSMINEQMINQ